jgi:hypothetical protein
MITGAHILFYSRNPEADRAFFRNVLRLPAVDAGGGWLIFQLPPAEAAFHPVGAKARRRLPVAGQMLSAELYLMCDDLELTLQELAAKNVHHSPPTEQEWGLKTTLRLPSGGEIGLYQPRHPNTLGLEIT